MKKNIKNLLVITMILVFALSLASVMAEQVTYGNTGNVTAFKLQGNDKPVAVDYGMKFYFGEGKVLTKFVVASIPTWGPRQQGEVENNTVTLTLYKWDTDYATTVSKTPIKKHVVVDHVDGQGYDFGLTTPLAAGTYLWTATAANSPEFPGIGLWGGPYENDNAISYFDGVADASASAFVARVFLTLEDAPNAKTADSSFLMVFVLMAGLSFVLLRKRVLN